MAIGSMMDGLDQQYVANKDDKGTWRILNTWHDELKAVDADADILDDSEAVTVVTEGEFIALIKEATRLGVLENANIGGNDAEQEAQIYEKEEEIHRLKQRISQLEEANSKAVVEAVHYRDHELKESAMNAIVKLVSMSDVSNLGGD